MAERDLAWTADLTATAALAALSEGRITARQLTEACLARISAHDGRLRAFAHVDAEGARAAADAADARRGRGWPALALQGLPVALKDNIDAAGMPCEWGVELATGRRPEADATLVRRLRAAGAVIIGKTVTTRFAFMGPGPTRNPQDAGRTPGGSSSGSAAAVAAGMVPLAFGTQTNGSVVRPASFCGVVGYKPSFGAIARTGILPAAPSFDTVGVFARAVEDAALAEATTGPDGRDAAARSIGPLRALAASPPPLPPVLAFVPGPFWERAAPETRAAFEELARALDTPIDRVPLPAAFGQAAADLRTVMAAEMAASLGTHADRAGAAGDPALRAIVAEGRDVRAPDYLAALERRRPLQAGLDAVFERYDAILTPAATGEAPEGLESTGDPIFCTLWSYLGLPAVSLPLLVGPNGLPVGVQLVGPMGDDARLLRTARWLSARLADAAAREEVPT